MEERILKLWNEAEKRRREYREEVMTLYEEARLRGIILDQSLIQYLLKNIDEPEVGRKLMREVMNTLIEMESRIPENCYGYVGLGKDKKTLVIVLSDKCPQCGYPIVTSKIRNGERVCGHEPVIYKLLSCLLYTSPSPRDLSTSRMPSSA